MRVVNSDAVWCPVSHKKWNKSGDLWGRMVSRNSQNHKNKLQKLQYHKNDLGLGSAPSSSNIYYSPRSWTVKQGNLLSKMEFNIVAFRKCTYNCKREFIELFEKVLSIKMMYAQWEKNTTISFFAYRYCKETYIYLLPL